MRQSAPRRPACRPLEFFRRSAQGTSDGSGRYGRAMHAVRAIGLTEPGPSAPSDGPNRLCRSNGSAPPGRRIEPTGPVRQIEPPDRQARRAARNARAMLLLAALRRRCVVRRGLSGARSTAERLAGIGLVAAAFAARLALAFVHDFADVLLEALLAGIASEAEKQFYRPECLSGAPRMCIFVSD